MSASSAMLARHSAATATATATGGPRSVSTALEQTSGPPRAAPAREREGEGPGRRGARAEVLVRRSAIAPCVTCGLCGRLLRDATAFPQCLHHFCRKCIRDKFTKEAIKCCPTCGIDLGGAPLEKLRSMIFPSKKRKVVRERVSSESNISSAVEIAVEERTALPQAHKNIVRVGRDALAPIKRQDFYPPCSLTAETGALILWQPQPTLEIVSQDQLAPRQDPEIAAQDQLAPRQEQEIVAPVQLVPREDPEKYAQDHLEPRQDPENVARDHLSPLQDQDPETLRPPTTLDKYQQQAPTSTNKMQMAKTLVVGSSSSHTRMTIQDDEIRKRDILSILNESNARIIGKYNADIGQLKAENAELKEELENERDAAAERTRILEERLQELENERTAAVERTRIIEERLQRELENEREAAAERMRVLEESLQSSSQIAQTYASRCQTLEADNAKLYEEVENGRAENRALMSDILEKSDELATLQYYSNIFESDRTCLENQVEDLKEELEYTRKEHASYVCQVLDAARTVPEYLEAQTGACGSARRRKRKRKPGATNRGASEAEQGGTKNSYITTFGWADESWPSR